MRRRGFLKRVSLIAASVAGIFGGGAIIRQLSPRGVKKSSKVKVGKVSDFPVDTYTLLAEEKIYIYRDHEHVQAMSAVCTHLGCVVQKADTGFECPCHGSVFEENGTVVKGPAPRALAWYKMEKAPDGKLIVDMDSSCGADEKLRIA